MFTRIVTDGRTDGSVTISPRNFVGEGIIKVRLKMVLDDKSHPTECLKGRSNQLNVTGRSWEDNIFEIMPIGQLGLFITSVFSPKTENKPYFEMGSQPSSITQDV